jgi:hypothetical protein
MLDSVWGAYNIFCLWFEAGLAVPEREQFVLQGELKDAFTMISQGGLLSTSCLATLKPIIEKSTCTTGEELKQK